MTAALDDLMESASQALAELNYAQCESMCVDALGKARDAGQWVLYQRILLPLQEARRQRRQSALDGPVLLGTPQQMQEPKKLFSTFDQGCVVLTWPCTAEDARSLSKHLSEQQLPAEVLYADNEASATTWRITSYTGPALSIDLPAPKAEWLGQWTDPTKIAPPTPAHWFMQASEALGNAALAAIDAQPGSLAYLQSLEQALSCVDDHEILHQRLAAAAKALHEAKR